MTDHDLVDIANAILEKTADNGLPPQIATALRAPTVDLLREVSVRFLGEARLDLAEAIFVTLKDRPEASHWVAAGLAQIAGRRGNAEFAAAQWRSCLRRFSDHIQPYWLLELARAERQLGDDQAAETTLRACGKQYPRFAPAAAALADLLQSTKRSGQASEEWLAALTDFLDEAQPWWFTAAAAALRDCGRADEGIRLLDQMCRRFPLAPTSFEHQAAMAAKREDWPKALELWTQCLERHADAVRPTWLNGCAIALFRSIRIDEALALWRRLISQFPNFDAGYVALAAAARELGWRKMEFEVLSELVERFGDRIKDDWLAQRTRCLFYLEGPAEAHIALKEFKSRFPNSPSAARVAIEFAVLTRHGLSEQYSLIETAARRFPSDRSILGYYVRGLLASGRIADADAVAKKLLTDQVDDHALVACWRVAADRDGDGVVEKLASHAVAHHSWTLAEGLPIGAFLMSLWSPWAVTLALSLFDDLAAQYPNRVSLDAARAEALVTLRKTQLALDAIDSIPAEFLTEPVLALRAWAHVQRREYDLARERWGAILATNVFPAVQTTSSGLNLLTSDRAQTADDAITLFVVVRDEIANLPDFLDHHRRIGIRRFVVIDNMSRDDSVPYLVAQPDVVLYQTDDDFESAADGMRWVNTLVRRRHDTGWSLFVDADERFIYPGWETAPLSALVKYLEDEGAEALSAFMLDVFPQRLYDQNGRPTPQKDYLHYDEDYVWLGHLSAPYKRPTGGVRARLFKAQEYLHKVPLIKSGRGIYITNHETTPMSFGSVSGALLHFKLHGLAVRAGETVSGTPQAVYVGDVSPEMMRRYQRYAARLDELRDIELRVQGVSKQLADSWTLVERSLMRAPADFRSWIERRG